MKGLEKLLLEIVDKRRVRSGHRHRAHPPSTNLAVSILSTDSRGYFGRAAGVLDADTGYAREEDDGDQAAEEEPGEEKRLMCFYLFCFFGSVCRILNNGFCFTWLLVVREGCRGPEENIL